MKARTLLLILAFAGCRERDVLPDGGRAPAVGGSTRILYPSAPGSFVDVITNARHGVVAIRAATAVKSGPAAMFPGAPDTLADVALGTGFLIEAKGVYVVTNDHIAAASTDLKVVLPDGSEVPAKLVGRDIRLDIALLSVALDQPKLQPLPLGDSNDLHVGEWLVVLGDPFGDEVTASVGIVSATGQNAAGSLTMGREMGYRTFLQTDARIHRGNSGGPVLDTAGEVVGVAVASGDRLGELSFAIPINRVKEVIGALRDFGQVARSWLGAKVKPVTPELAQSAGLPKPGGALITEVMTASPAARAGLRANDIVLQWDGKDVSDKSLPWIVAQTVVGKTLTIGLWRNHAAASATIVTEKMPE
jgi:serine protease Do